MIIYWCIIIIKYQIIGTNKLISGYILSKSISTLLFISLFYYKHYQHYY